MYFQEANKFGLVSVSGNSVSELPDYSALASQLAMIKPSNTDAGSYNPTNSAAACPTSDASWSAATVLPPTPNKQLCDCMTASLSCAAKSDISSDTLTKTFALVCGYSNGQYCKGIASNGTSGVYGAYSMCNPVDQLSFALNAYYQSQNKASTACDFNGAASTKTTSSASGSCSGLLGQAGSDGTATVSGGSGGAAATSSAAASSLLVPSADGLNWRAIAVALGSFMAGAGLILV